MPEPTYRRVVVKLSGEALSGPDKFGMHQPTIDTYAADLVAARALGMHAVWFKSAAQCEAELETLLR